MSTTILRKRAFDQSPFAFLETRQVIRLALRIERSLERAGPALLEGRVSRERYGELVHELRGRIDGLAEVSRALMEALE